MVLESRTEKSVLPASGAVKQQHSHNPEVKMRHRGKGAAAEIWSRCGPPASAQRAAAGRRC